MRAVLAERYGSPEVLVVRQVPLPEPGEGDVLIRVKAAEINKADCELRSFNFPVKWFWLPLRLAFGVFRPRRPILGGYFSGEVVSAPAGGEGHLKPGDAVFGCAQMRMGAHAEFVTLPADYPLAIKPAGIGYPEAAALPLGALNAVHFLDRAELRAGQSILIVGGGGSIGLAAIQMAKARGAVVTVVDKSSKEPVVRDAGADHFIDYTRESYADREERYDVVFTMVPSDSYNAGLNQLKPAGCYVMGNPRLVNMLRSVLTGMTSSRRVVFAFAPETSEALVRITRMVEAGELRPLVDTVLPLSAAVEGHRRVENEQRSVSIVLDLESR